MLCYTYKKVLKNLQRAGKQKKWIRSWNQSRSESEHQAALEANVTAREASQLCSKELATGSKT